jgi:hypothetical protein
MCVRGRRGSETCSGGGDVDGDEGWLRLTNEPEVRGVEAEPNMENAPWTWSLSVWAMEFVREEPLESELRAAIGVALESVPGVAEALEEDREVWAIAGSPDGEALVAAVADAVDGLAPRFRTHIQSPGPS